MSLSALSAAVSAPTRLIGGSAAMAELRGLIGQVGMSEASVLINGPSGSGKELAARAIHEASGRAKGPFIALNCGAVPRELLESELFGHERGAFTGAHSQRIGRFEAAAGGTLFLDEIGDMPLDMQVSLLRVLEERRFERIGSTKALVADVRIVSATHRDLPQAIAAGRFREDLYYRLNVFPLLMPALSERRDDVPELALHFAGLMGERGPRFSVAALRRMAQHDWPGNVRELRNFVERAAIRFHGVEVGAAEVEAVLARAAPSAGSPAAQSERAALLAAVGAIAPPPLRPSLDALARGAPLPPAGGPPPARSAAAAFAAILPDQVLAEGTFDLKGALTELERGFIDAALQRSGGVVADAARLLGLQRTTLVEKLRRMSPTRAGEGEPQRLAA